MWSLKIIQYVGLLVLSIGSVTFADIKLENVDGDRESRVLPIFQVVRFPNDICAGNAKNGTCYTAEECSAKGGTKDGSCASGFGVCCVIQLSCGGSTSDNNSYIIQSGVTTLASPCAYTVCPCSTDICRIRYDFTTHTLASQVVSSIQADAQAADTIVANDPVGDCLTDTFSIQSPGKFGSPIICGQNSGQHMIIDVGEGCQTVNFQIGASTSTTRQWNIFVSQYTCGQEDIAGPPGCLQYHTALTGVLKNFGYPTANTNAATAADTTHLSNQNYEICIRRAAAYCYICYSTWHATMSFGLSIGAGATDNHAMLGTDCTLDYITIPGAHKADIAAITTPTVAALSRFCGRFLNTAEAAAEATLCSRVIPFRLGFKTNNNEICSIAIAADTCELDLAPGGIVGFALYYDQKAC